MLDTKACQILVRKILLAAAAISVMLLLENYCVRQWGDTEFSRFSSGIAPLGVSVAAQHWWLGLVPGVATCIAFVTFLTGRHPRVSRGLSLLALGIALLTEAAWAWGVLAPLAYWQYRVRRMDADVARADARHPWAGHYYLGDGLGFNFYVTLTPRAEFLSEWRGCMGVYERNQGRIVVDGPRIWFITAERRWEYYLVPWGDRHYLIGADERNAFCEDVRAGREPRTEVHGNHYLRESDEGRAAAGEPGLCRNGRMTD
jgi:hypothetical protein